MEEKVNEINKFVKNLKNNAQKIPSLGLNGLAGFLLACDDVIAFIDSLEKEPESNTVWHGKDEKPDFGTPILVIDCFGQPYSGYYNGINPRMVENWVYIKDLVDCKERHFGDKNEMVSEDLEEEYEKYFKEHETDIVLNPYSNCKDIAQHFAEWQKQKDLEDSLKSDMTMPNKFYEKGKADAMIEMKETLQTEYEKGRFDMREEMMTDAVEAEVVIDRIGEVVYLCPHLSEETGDKAKIIIVKEEQQ